MQDNYDDFLQELDVFLKEYYLEEDKDNIIFEKSYTAVEVKNQENIEKTDNKNLEKIKRIEFKNIKSDVISINNLIEDDKPREKLLKFGVKSLSEYELIAILLRSGTPQEDVLNLSKKLWIYLSKLQSISDLTMSDLMSINGIGVSKASIILSAIELAKRFNLRESIGEFSIENPRSVANIFVNTLNDDMKEHFYVLLLNTKNKIISWDEISKGDLNSSIVHPREVFKYALKNSANSIICLHNHPSGDTTPSKEDIEITKRLVEVGNLVGIRLLDHIIIGGNSYVSLREKGII